MMECQILLLLSFAVVPATSYISSLTMQHGAWNNTVNIDSDKPVLSLKVFNYLTAQDNTSAIVQQISCRKVGYMLHLLDDGTSPSDCSYSSTDAIVQCNPDYVEWISAALNSIVRNYDYGVIVLLYTDKYVSHAYTLMNKLEGSTKVTMWTIDMDNLKESTADVWDYITSFIDAIIILADNTDGQKILLRAGADKQFSSAYTWYVLNNGSPDSWRDVIEPGRQIVILDSDVSQERSDCYSHKSPRFPLWIISLATEETEKVGHWTLKNGLQLKREHIWEFTHFVNKTFYISTLNLPVFHYKEENAKGTVWNGICIEMINLLSQNLKFDFVLVEPPDLKWGAPNDDGTWNGMVGEVYRKQTDFAIGKFTITQIRDTVIDFADPFWHEAGVMVMRKPEEESLLIYVASFKYQVWLTIAGVFFVWAFVMAVVLHFEEKLQIRPVKLKSAFGRIKSTIWMAFRVQITQGAENVPTQHEPASRVIFAFFLFYVLTLNCLYCGNLTASIAVPKINLPIQTLEDLAKSNYKYGTLASSAMSTLFQTSTFHLYQTIWKNSMQYDENMAASHKNGLERVKSDSKYIYLGEFSGVSSVVYNDCVYALGKEEFFPSSFAWAFPENSPLLPVFNEKINYFVENGMISKWRLDHYPTDFCSLAGEESSTVAASLTDVQGVFIFLACGILATLILLIGEIIHWQCKKRNVRRRNAVSDSKTCIVDSNKKTCIADSKTGMVDAKTCMVDVKTCMVVLNTCIVEDMTCTEKLKDV